MTDDVTPKIIGIDIRLPDNDVTFFFEHSPMEHFHAGEFSKESRTGRFLRNIEAALIEYNEGR